MKISQYRKLRSSDFPTAPSFFTRFLDGIAGFFENVALALSNRLTFSENMLAAVLDKTFTSGTEQLIAYPIKSKPVGILPLSAGCTLTGFRDAGNNTIGVTFNQIESVSYVRVTRANDKTISNNTVTAVDFDENSIATGNGLVHSVLTNTTRITTARNCRVLVTYSVGFDVNNVGTRSSWVSINGTTSGKNARYAHNALQANGSDETTMTGASVITLAAGDYVELYVFQNSGANRTLECNGSYSSYLEARVLEYTDSPSLDVKFVVTGG